jgi:hypothetical protein
MEPCHNRYMLRKKLEPKLDHLLGEKLREPSFLSSVLDAYNVRQTCVLAPVGTEPSAIAAHLQTLDEKKQRVLEAFFEGVINKGDRDSRLAELSRDRDAHQHLLTATVNPTPPLDMQDLQACLEPFAEWEYLDRHDKRTLLPLICPQINISRYTVKSIGLNLEWTLPSGDNDSHSKTET